MLVNRLLIVLAMSIGIGCVSPRTTPRQPPPAKKKAPPAVSELIPKITDRNSKFKADPRYRENCSPFSEKLQTLPVFVSGASAVVSRFLKDCITAEGKEGYLPGSPWTALGFPCTGGQGKIDLKGSQYNPKLATFSFTNSCPMTTNDPARLEQQIRQELPLPAESKLIAYYPFSVVFWQFPEFGDSDVGYDLELYSPAALKMGWKSFQALKPIQVRLYGSENSLVKSENLYQVDGNIEKQGANSFRLQVESVKLLSAEEREQIKQNCYSLSPRRNCSQSF